MLLQSLIQLLFPIQCASCAAPNVELCDICARAWRSKVQVGRVDQLSILWSAGYSPLTSPIVLAAKEDNHRRSQIILAEALDRGLAEARRRNWIDANQRLYLVPIPSTKQSNRRRGHFHLRSVIDHMTSQVIFSDVLEITRKVVDQSSLARQERHENLHGAYRVRPTCALSDRTMAEIRQGVLVICDDLVTSGSSLREAVRALKVAKISPEFALSACAAGAF